MVNIVAQLLLKLKYLSPDICCEFDGPILLCHTALFFVRDILVTATFVINPEIRNGKRRISDVTREKRKGKGGLGGLVGGGGREGGRRPAVMITDLLVTV